MDFCGLQARFSVQLARGSGEETPFTLLAQWRAKFGSAGCQKGYDAFWSVHYNAGDTALNDAPKPTIETYRGFQRVYDAFNEALFDGELPNCLITLQRRNRTYGYFSGNRFHREDGRLTDEIALNPAHFRQRSVSEVLATLVHEMVHLWQHHDGKPGRGRYHNRQWARKMKAIGLQPTDTGEEGGKETGDSVHHIVLSEGRFSQTVRSIVAQGFAIRWIEKPTALASRSKAGGDTDEVQSKSGKRVKYVCSLEECEQKAWARHEANLICGDHMMPMIPSLS